MLAAHENLRAVVKLIDAIEVQSRPRLDREEAITKRVEPSDNAGAAGVSVILVRHKGPRLFRLQMRNPTIIEQSH